MKSIAVEERWTKESRFCPFTRLIHELLRNKSSLVIGSDLSWYISKLNYNSDAHEERIKHVTFEQAEHSFSMAIKSISPAMT